MLEEWVMVWGDQELITECLVQSAWEQRVYQTLTEQAGSGDKRLDLENSKAE